MTKLWNNPDNFREEMLEGFVAANGRYVRRVPGASGVIAVDAPRNDRVSLLVGGGENGGQLLSTGHRHALLCAERKEGRGPAVGFHGAGVNDRDAGELATKRCTRTAVE